MKALITFIVVALFFTPFDAFAGVVTLREAIAKALAANHRIKAGENMVAAAEEDISIAGSHLKPRLVLEDRFMRTSNPTYGFMAKLNQQRFSMQDFAIDNLNHPRPVNDFQASVAIEQPLYAPAAVIGTAMSREAHAGRAKEQERAREQIVMDTARSYLMALMAREYVQLSEQGLAEAREHKRIAELRYKNGLGLYSDILRAATALIGAEQRQVSAEKNYAVARYSLGLLMASPEMVEIVEDTGLVQPLHDLSVYEAAAEERFDIKALEHNVANAENNIKLARTGYLPTVGLGSSYQINDHDSPLGAEGDSWQLMVKASWELFAGGRTGHEVRKAAHQQAAAREELAGLREAARFQVNEAYLAVIESRKNKELAASALASAEEGQRLVKVRYENSLATMVELLDAQTSLDMARADVVTREREHELAMIRLGFQSGTIVTDLAMEKRGAK